MSAGFFGGQVDETRVRVVAESGDWPFDLVGPEESCPCGCPCFKRLGDGGWRCEGCGEVVYEDCPAPCEGCEAVVERGDDCLLDRCCSVGRPKKEKGSDG